MADELVFTLSIKDNASPQIDAFTRKIKGLGQEAQKEFGAFRENFNKSFGDLGKPIKDIDGLKTALSGLAGTGAAFAVSKAGDFIVDSVKNFAAYESALVSVQRTMGLTKKELDTLGESLRTLALTDLKGQVKADDLAQIAEVAGSLGVAKDDLLDFTKNVAMVASATDQSMETVATSFGKISNVFKESLGGDEAYTKIGAIGSAFDKLADDMAATVPGITNFVNRMGGAATAMHLTVDETAALAAVLESVGLPAERGSTAMNNVMLGLMRSSKSFAEALSIDAEKLSTALRDKPVEALQMVFNAMEELGKTKGQEALLNTMEDLLGKGNGVTEVVLKMQGAQKDLSTALASSKQAFDDATRAGESFNQAASTQEASWKSVTTAVDDLSKSLGQQLKPATEGASQGLAILATDIANTFRADTINQFFDDIVSGFADLKSADLTDWLRAIPTAATQTISDLRGIVTGGITDILGGLTELIGAGDWFAGLVTNAKQAFGEIKAVIQEAFGGGTAEEYQAEMENIFSAQEIGLQNVTAAMGEKTAATQADLDALIALKTENLDLLRTNQDLRAEYQGVARDLGAAIESGQAPTAELTARMEALRQKIYDVGSEAVYNSTFPDMITAMQASQAQTQALTAEMAAMQAQIKGLGAEYEATDKQIQEKQDSIRDLNTQIREQQTLLRTASEAEKEGIQNTITQIRNKKDAIQSEISDLQELSRDQKEARKAEETALKESIKQLKEKQKAVDELAKNTQRTAELRAKQQQEEAKAANDLYREQQKQAADSIKWVSDLDDATKKRVMGEQDAVKVLKEQGVTLTTLQEQELRRMQGAYKTEQAYEAQAKALEKQLGTSATLAENMSSLGNALSNIGGALNIEGLGDIGGGLSALPDAFKNIKDSFSGLKDGLAGMKNGFSGFLDGITSITGAVSALMSAWKIGESIFEGIKSLFKNTKSEGTEAAEAFQKFVAKNISGGAQLEAALKTNFDAMTAAGFDFQTFLQQTGTTMDQTFGGISANWQQGSTAMDLFTQAVGRATGDMAKAPQVALQMMASFQDMGLSAEEAGAKMLEIAEAAGMSQAEIEALKAALAAGGAEGESTTAVFDAATQAATELAGTTQNLTGDVQTLTGTLAGAGSEGGDTTKIFTAASDAAKQLDSDSQTLSGDVSTLTQQLSGAGAETLATSNLFTMAGGSAAGLQRDVNNLDSQVATANASLAATQKALADIPNEKTVMFRVVTVGSPPRMATGGTIGASGLAIVNERGSEIAHFPGGGMALMTAPGPTLGAFPTGTEIIPHSRSMEILSQFPGIPRMATGGTISGSGGTVINVNITGNNITKDTDLKALARQVSAEISRNYNAMR